MVLRGGRQPERESERQPQPQSELEPDRARGVDCLREDVHDAVQRVRAAARLAQLAGLQVRFQREFAEQLELGLLEDVHGDDGLVTGDEVGRFEPKVGGIGGGGGVARRHRSTHGDDRRRRRSTLCKFADLLVELA